MRVTYSNDPVNCESDEVEDRGRFLLRVKMMSLGERIRASTQIFGIYLYILQQQDFEICQRGASGRGRHPAGDGTQERGEAP